jgi:hypothetical protein
LASFFIKTFFLVNATEKFKNYFNPKFIKFDLFNEGTCVSKIRAGPQGVTTGSSKVVASRLCVKNGRKGHAA